MLVGCTSLKITAVRLIISSPRSQLMLYYALIILLAFDWPLLRHSALMLEMANLGVLSLGFFFLCIKNYTGY